MKYKILITALAGWMLFASSCKKDTVASFASGDAPVLSGSATNIAPSPADSSDTVVVFFWTSPNYSVDSATIKYVLQVDTAADFSQAISFEQTGKRTAGFTGWQIDSILLNYGLALNTPYTLHLRVLSSYSNNNNQKISASLAVTMQGYAVPPKVAPPSGHHLYIIGSATAGTWSNPVPVPSQEFAALDSVTYVGVFYLTANGAYDLLPVNGSWDTKYAVHDASVSGLANGGAFDFFASGGSDIPGPSTAGWYVILVNFQTGMFTVTPFTGMLPSELFITGDATPAGWMAGGGSGVPVPDQQFTQENSAVFDLSLSFVGGGAYILLPANGDYSQKYAVSDASVPGLDSGGDFQYYTSGGANIPGPAAAGTYSISVNFATGMFKVTPQ